MRLRVITVAATAAGTLLVPPASQAQAAATTSTIVAYTADVNGNGVAELYTRPADGTGSPTRVFMNTVDVWLPSLSPDGTQLAYLMADATANGERIYRLHVRPTSGSATSTLRLDKNVYGSVSWSADGTKIVASTYDFVNDTWGTYIVDAAGSTAPTLVPTTDVHYGEEPSLSPSGDVVAIDAFNSEFEYVGIDLVSLATGKRARIVGTADGSDPSWSPDGRYILFQRLLGSCGVGLYRVPASGGAVTTLREVTNRFLGSAEYSRDGSQIFFSDSPMRACGTTAKGDIWAMNPDGTGAARVTDTPTVTETGSTVAGAPPLAADTTAPGAPSVNAKNGVGATTATLTWWPSADDVVEYVVVRKPLAEPTPTSPTDGTAVYRGPARTTTDTGLTTGDDYAYYIYAVDASGNVSDEPTGAAVRPTPTPAVGTIGRVGTTTTGPTFNVTWGGAHARKFDVRVGQRTRAANGTWSASPAYTTLKEATADTVTSFTGAQGRSFYFSVRAHDVHGNVTAWSAPQRADVPVDDAWSGMSYSSGWVAKSATTRFAGTYHTTITPNAAMSAKADTQRFVVIGDKCSTCGQFKVYVDGVHRATIDTRSATSQTRQVLYASGVFSAIKPHTIKIVAVGTKGRPRVSIDAIALQR